MRGTVLLALLVAGCSSGIESYVAPVSAESGARAAYDIADFVRTRLRPGEAIAVQAPTGDGVVGPDLASDLQTEGYVLAPDAKHKLAYVVSTIADGTYVRIQLDGIDAARLYHTFSGGMEPAGPFTVEDRS